MKPGGGLSAGRTKDGKKVVLRTLAKKDLEEVFRFATALFRERKTNPDLGIVALDRRVTRKDEGGFLRRTLKGVERRQAVSVAAFVDGRLVGNCDVTRRTFHDVSHSGVLGIAILDGCRNIGLGEMMVRTALRESKRIGVWLVELQVFANNSNAIHLYEKCGFIRVGVVPGKIQRHGRLIDEVLMFVDLRTSDKSAKLGRKGR